MDWWGLATKQEDWRLTLLNMKTCVDKSEGERSSHHAKVFSFTCFAFWCWGLPLTVPTAYWCSATKSDLVNDCRAAVGSSCTTVVKYRCCGGTTWCLWTGETVWARLAALDYSLLVTGWTVFFICTTRNLVPELAISWCLYNDQVSA